MIRVDRSVASSVQAFIDVERGLYRPKERKSSAEEIRQIMKGTHPLSDLFTWEAYYETNSSRGMLFYPRGQNFGYIGYLEGKTSEALQRMLQFLWERGKEQGIQTLYGPVNLSFWTGYRLRMPNEKREEAYFGEPWNQDFYADAFVKAGFTMAETYVSNHYSKESALTMGENEKSLRRFCEAKEKGYIFAGAKRDHWEKQLRDVHALILETYKDFPLFHPISFSQFYALFGPMERILDFSMVEMVYKENILQGFTLTLPDYGTLLQGNIGLFSLMEILKRRRKASHYVILYMAVRPGGEGLGLAMAYNQFQKIRKRKASATAALIHQGKFTQFYEKEKITDSTEYVLFKWDID